MGKLCFMLSVSIYLMLYTTCTMAANQEHTVSLTILYDNYASQKTLEADWGFSCLIEGTEKTILFDTGANKDIWHHNIERIKPKLNTVSQVVISHKHSDHIGNLFNFLDVHNTASVYLPYSFPEWFLEALNKMNAHVVAVDKPVEISRNVFLTGQMHSNMDVVEQSLIIDTDKGLVVITGCAHPGIVNIVKKAKEIVKKDVYLLVGGFHLLGSSEEGVQTIIRQLKDLNVLNVGPSHCTGDEAIELFKKAYGEHYIQLGAGKVINISVQTQ